jgi:hypothetical protein
MTRYKVMITHICRGLRNVCIHGRYPTFQEALDELYTLNLGDDPKADKYAYIEVENV